MGQPEPRNVLNARKRSRVGENQSSRNFCCLQLIDTNLSVRMHVLLPLLCVGSGTFCALLLFSTRHATGCKVPARRAQIEPARDTRIKFRDRVVFSGWNLAALR